VPDTLENIADYLRTGVCIGAWQQGRVGAYPIPRPPSREKAAQPSPQAWLSCKTKMQFLKLCAERSGAHLKS